MMKAQPSFPSCLFYADLYLSSPKSFVRCPKCKFAALGFTANFLALVQSITAVVLPVADPLFGDALVFRAGELIPEAR